MPIDAGTINATIVSYYQSRSYGELSVRPNGWPFFVTRNVFLGFSVVWSDQTINDS